MSTHDLHPDPADDVTGNGLESHYDLARQLEMRGYTVDADTDDNEHSYVRFGDEHVGDIHGDAVATVTTHHPRSAIIHLDHQQRKATTMKTNPTELPGTLLATAPAGSPGERRHLCRLDDGTFALVESWPFGGGSWGETVRRYSVWNLIGSHLSVAQALERFQCWNRELI